MCTCMHVHACVRTSVHGRETVFCCSLTTVALQPSLSFLFVVRCFGHTKNGQLSQIGNGQSLSTCLALLALADACCCCSLVVCVVRLLLACCWCCCCCVLLLFACCWFVWFVCTGAQGQAGKGSSGNETQLGSTAQHSGRKQTTKNAPMQSTQGARDASS